MNRTSSPEAEARNAKQAVRCSAVETLAEQCGRSVEHDAPGAETLRLVKATKPDGRRLEAVLKLANQFGVTHLDLTPTSPTEGHPTAETVTFVLPPQDFEIVADSHGEIPTRTLEDAVFLARDLQTQRPRIVTDECREVHEISHGRYQQLSGNR